MKSLSPVPASLPNADSIASSEQYPVGHVLLTRSRNDRQHTPLTFRTGRPPPDHRDLPGRALECGRAPSTTGPFAPPTAADFQRPRLVSRIQRDRTPAGRRFILYDHGPHSRFSRTLRHEFSCFSRSVTKRDGEVKAARTLPGQDRHCRAAGPGRPKSGFQRRVTPALGNRCALARRHRRRQRSASPVLPPPALRCCGLQYGSTNELHRAIVPACRKGRARSIDAVVRRTAFRTPCRRRRARHGARKRFIEGFRSS